MAFVPDWKNDFLSKQEVELNLTFLGPESQASKLFCIAEVRFVIFQRQRIYWK